MPKVLFIVNTQSHSVVSSLEVIHDGVERLNTSVKLIENIYLLLLI